MNIYNLYFQVDRLGGPKLPYISRPGVVSRHVICVPRFICCSFFQSRRSSCLTAKKTCSKQPDRFYLILLLLLCVSIISRKGISIRLSVPVSQEVRIRFFFSVRAHSCGLQAPGRNLSHRPTNRITHGKGPAGGTKSRRVMIRKESLPT